MSNTEIKRYVFNNHIPQSLLIDVYKDNEHFKAPPDFYLEVSCGSCEGCKKKYRQEWAFRLLQEINSHKASIFFTLTIAPQYYKEDTYEIINSKGKVCNPKKELMLYIDRLRKYLGFRPRYYIVSELGDDKHHTGRLHFHGIFFGTSKEAFSYADARAKWKYGNSWTGYVDDCTGHYLSKYLLKRKGNYKPFMLCSNGIGAKYVTKANMLHHLNAFDFRLCASYHGAIYPLSSYYLRKFFNDDINICKMVNRYSNPNYIYYLNGQQYTSEIVFKYARETAYNLSVMRGLSPRINKCKIKQKLTYNINELWQVTSIPNQILPILKHLSETSQAVRSRLSLSVRSILSKLGTFSLVMTLSLNPTPISSLSR